jgi:hypothetical protein
MMRLPLVGIEDGSVRRQKKTFPKLDFVQFVLR